MSLYAPYKAVGIVTDGKPFAVNQLGTETFLTVSIGSVFQVYRVDKLTVCLVGRETPGAEDITALAVADKETFCAVGNKILVYNRTQLVRTYEEHAAASKLLGLCMVGRTLLSWDDKGELRVIDTQKRVVLSVMQSLQNSAISVVAHPATYINKFVVGYASGALELWNVRKCKLVHTFTCHTEFFESAKAASALEPDSDADFFARNTFNDNNTQQEGMPGVTCLQQSPATDVFGMGFSDGTILMINLKLDRVLFSFKQEGGAVTSLAFRTDSSAQEFPFMASSSGDGRIHIWNLGAPAEDADDESPSDSDSDADDEPKRPKLVRKLQTTLEEAHRGAISSIQFLHGEPIMISAAEDNTIKMWIFDAPDGSARLLRSREGHIGHSNKIRYYGGDTAISMRDNTTAESCEMVSAGSDGTLRLFNTAIESQNREMSQKPILKKLGLSRRNERLPVVSDFDFSETRQRDWGNMVTIHHHHANAYLWRYKHRVVTEVVLRQPQWHGDERIGSTNRMHHSTAVAVTPCGNFALVGSRGGVIYRYNLQSGLPRGSFPKDEAKSAIKKGTIETLTRKPGNVLHEHKKLMGGSGWVPLNAAKGPTEAEAKAAALQKKLLEQQQELPSRHVGEIRGLFVDLSNSVLVSVSLDGTTLFWDMDSGKVVNCIRSDTAHLMLVGLRDAGFAAVASQDRIVRVYDLATCKLARRFSGHSREISDMAFTPDGRRLLSSSSDSTVRVWDMPTGRCLTWLSFSAPVLSLAVALSGESLAISQAGKDGIYLYVDRSLYEPVMFWKEPTKPVPVADSAVVSVLAEDAFTATTTGAADGEDENDEDRADGSGSDNDEGEREIKATQAQVETGAARESTEQRAPGAITMSALPRGYWSSLFHLEVIKARNKPVAPVAPPKSAPFFLPTVFRGGSTSSFPTPQEFAKLENNLKQESEQKKQDLADAGKRALASASADAAAALAPSGKKQKKAGAAAAATAENTEEPENEEDVMAQLAAMGSSWNDNDDDDGNWGSAPNSHITESHAADFRPMAASTSSGSKADDDAAAAAFPDSQDNQKQGSRIGSGSSRLISRRTVLPRCKLVAYLLQEFPDSALGTYASAEFFKGGSAGAAGAADSGSASATLDYLKTLAPPAVDLEFRALCTHGEDEEGLKLLHCLLSWLAQCMSSGRDFEVLEAYLHRTLLVYGEIIVTKPSLLSLAQRISAAHADSSERLRGLVQGNLCLLKLFAGLPPL